MKKKNLRYQRKFSNYLINKKLQLRHAAVLTGFSLLISVVFGVFLYYQTNIFLDVIEQLAGPEITQMPGFDNIGEHMIFCIVAIIIMNSVILTVVGIVVSHSVAGPLYRMEQQLIKLGQGDLSYVYFRKHDLCHSLEETYNNSVDLLRKQKEAQNDKAQVIIATVQKICQRLNQDPIIKSQIKDGLVKIRNEAEMFVEKESDNQ